MTNVYETIYGNPSNGRDIEFLRDKEQVTVIRVHTKEPITPGWLAYRIAQACGGTALREGESISVDGLSFTVGPDETSFSSER